MDRYDPYTDKFLRDTQYNILSTNLVEVGTDCISRAQAIDAFNTGLNELVVGGEENAKTVENYLNGVIEKIKCLPSAQPDMVRCKDCKYWNSGTCECPEHVVNCQDYWVGDIETDANYFCGYAERRGMTE